VTYDHRRERALAIAHGAGADALLAAHPGTVTWLTGFAPEIELGPNPFTMPPLAVLAAGEAPIIVVSEDDAPVAEELGCEAATYTGFTIAAMEPLAGAAAALGRAVAGRRVATEPGALPAALASALAAVDVERELLLARAVKDEDELAKIRAAIALCDAGQSTARSSARAGLTELELWATVRGAMETAAAGRVPALADVVSGPRAEEGGGPPGPRALTERDLVICDLVPRLDGYWGDSCSTIAVGEPSASAREKHRRAREALERGLEAIRPGVRAGDLDALVRADLGYPHHTGHGLGVSWHEEPRIVPGSPTILDAGMIVALEPAVYTDGEGIRVEQITVVTPDGCDILSAHSLDL
jgi:Xaa-Pro dipeptidase